MPMFRENSSYRNLSGEIQMNRRDFVTRSGSVLAFRRAVPAILDNLLRRIPTCLVPQSIALQRMV
jgi:hypothetical protein